MALVSIFKQSFKEFKSVRCLTTTGVMIAVSVVLEMYTLPIGTSQKLNFAFIPLAIIGLLFGPAVAGISGIICDVAGFMVGPPMGAFNPFFSIVTMCSGIIYGTMLYNLDLSQIKIKDIFVKKLTKNEYKQVGRIFTARLINNVVCYIGMNSVLIYYFGTLRGEAFIYATWVRVIKNIAMLPIEAAMLVAILYPTSVAYRRTFGMKGQVKA